MKPPSIATLSNFDDEHRERALAASRKRKRPTRRGKRLNMSNDPHTGGVVLLMGEETKCPLCGARMVRRKLNGHRREAHRS